MKLSEQIVNLRSQIKAQVTELDSLDNEIRQAPSEGENNAADLQKRFDDLVKKIEQDKAELSRLEKREKFVMDNLDEETRHEPKAPAIIENKKDRKFSIGRALKLHVEGKLDGYEKEMSDEARSANKSLGINDMPLGRNALHLPASAFAQKRAMTVGVPADGGSTVALEKMGWLENLTSRTVLNLAGRSLLSGLVGNVDLNRGSATGVTIQGETAAAPDYAQKTDVAELRPSRYTAHQDLSFQLLNQSSVVIDAIVQNEMFRSLAAKMDEQGIATVAGDANLPVVGAGAGQAASFDLLAQAPNVVGDKNVFLDETSAWIMKYAARGKLQGTPREAGDARMMMDEVGGSLIGYNVFPSSQVPDTKGGGTHYDVLFGVWSQLYQGEWGTPILTYDDISQAQNGALRLVINAYTGWAIGRIEAFAAQYIAV